MNLTLSNLVGTLQNLFKIGKLTLSASGVSTPKTINAPDIAGTIAVIDVANTLTVGGSLTVPQIEGSASPGGELVLTSTSNAGKGKIYLGAAKQSVFDENYGLLGLKNTSPDSALTIGTRSVVASMSVIGYEVASDTLSMGASNWTLGTGFSGTNNGNVAVTKDTDGLGSAVYTGTPVPWSGALYRVEIGLSATVYGAQASFGGVNIPLSYSSSTAYVVTENTNPFTINSIVNGSRFVVSSVIISEVGGNCGDIRAGGFIRLAGRLVNASGSATSGLSVRPNGSVKFDSYAKAVSAFEAPTIRGGTAAAVNLALSSTSDATKGKITFGTSVYDEVNNRLGINDATPTEALEIGTPDTDGGNTIINGTLGVELAPSMAAAGWTLGTGWDATNAGGTALSKNVNGTGTATPSGTTNIINGTAYKVVITVADISVASGFTWTLGGVTIPAITAAGTYTYYVRASSTGKVVFTPTPTATRFTISAVSIKAISSGDITAYGDIKATRLIHPQGTAGLHLEHTGAIRTFSNLTLPGVINVVQIANAYASSSGLVLSGTTSSATAAAPVQMAPRLLFSGTAWDSSSNTHHWKNETIPIYDATTITSKMIWSFAYNATTTTAFVDRMNLGSEGALDVFGSTLGAQALTNPNFTGNATSWTLTGDIAYSANTVVYTHSTGVGALTQAAASLATPLVANRWYSFTYTTSAVTAGVTAYIGLEASSKRIYLNLVAGTYTAMFKSASSPTDFKIYFTSTAGAVTLDTMTLKEVQSGDIIANGLFTGGGTDGIKITGDGLVNVTNTLVLPKTQNKGIKVDTAVPTYPWHDIIGAINIRQSGASVPTYSLYRDNIYQYAFSKTVLQEVFIEFHIPHDYVMGTNLFIHAHWSQSVVDTGGAASAPGVCKWSFESTYAKGYAQAAFPASRTVSVTQTASSTQYMHQIAEVQLSATSPGATQLDSAQLEPDGIILVRCFRDPGDVADTVNELTFLHFVDIHYQSTAVGTKQKNGPTFWA